MGAGGELGLAVSMELQLWFWIWSRFLLWIVVEGKALTALQPEVPGFHVEIVAVWNFSTKLLESDQLGFAFPALTPRLQEMLSCFYFLSSLLALCPLPVVGAHILLSSATGAS